MNMSIKENFEKGIYELEAIPYIIEIRGGNVKINKYAPYPNEIKSLESSYFNSDLIETNKLISPYRDSEFSVGTISTEHFESREKLDSLFLKYVNKPFSQNYEKISIDEAFQMLNVDVSCNMEYYLDHKEEIEKDLDRKVDESELINVNKLEQELFYNQMLKLFGTEDVPESFDESLNKEEPNYEKACMLKDFHILCEENFHYATAQRGNHYLVFEYAF